MENVKPAVGGAPTIEVCYFKKGDAVPPWLLSSEPLGADSAPVKMVFTMDVSVVNAKPGWWVLPFNPVGIAVPPMVVVEGHNSAVLAPGDTVIFVTDAAVMPGNPNVKDWLPGGPKSKV